MIAYKALVDYQCQVAEFGGNSAATCPSIILVINACGAYYFAGCSRVHDIYQKGR